MADTKTADALNQQQSETASTSQSGTERQDLQRAHQPGNGQTGNGQTGNGQTGNRAMTQAMPGTRQGQLQRRGTWPNDPFSLMQRMSDEMDELFETFGFGRGLLPGWRLPGFEGTTAPRSLRPGTELARTAWSPQIEVREKDNQLLVTADLPGMKKEDVKIEVEDDVLTISGERKDEREEKREGFYHSERSYGSFVRRIPLPEGVNAEEVKASFKDGVLEVKMPAPRRQETRSRQIEILG